MGIEAVIFDIDGTLIDSVDAHAEAWARVFARHGHDIAAPAVRTQIGKGGDKLLAAFLDEAEVERIGDTLERERGELFRAEYLPGLKPFPGVAELFRRLRADRRRIGLASSAKGHELEDYKRLAGIEALVDRETSSDDVERTKPHPDIFQAALARLGVPPGRALAVGDTPYDAQAAGGAGLRSIGFRCGGFPEGDIRAAGAREIYDGPADLLARYEASLIRRG